MTLPIDAADQVDAQRRPAGPRRAAEEEDGAADRRAGQGPPEQRIVGADGERQALHHRVHGREERDAERRHREGDDRPGMKLGRAHARADSGARTAPSRRATERRIVLRRCISTEEMRRRDRSGRAARCRCPSSDRALDVAHLLAVEADLVERDDLAAHRPRGAGCRLTSNSLAAKCGCPSRSRVSHR